MANHLAFRDYLRSHPEQALAYAILKRQLALRFPFDVNAYCLAKTEFIVRILQLAGFPPVARTFRSH
jgi:GrpB-like predicted nucleotidyltransferase (UPF0157 family)